MNTLLLCSIVFHQIFTNFLYIYVSTISEFLFFFDFVFFGHFYRSTDGRLGTRKKIKITIDWHKIENNSEILSFWYESANWLLRLSIKKQKTLRKSLRAQFILSKLSVKEKATGCHKSIIWNDNFLDKLIMFWISCHVLWKMMDSIWQWSRTFFPFPKPTHLINSHAQLVIETYVVICNSKNNYIIRSCENWMNTVRVIFQQSKNERTLYPVTVVPVP